MLLSKRSFKFKILSIVLLSFLILIGLVPIIINKTIDATVSEYEKKSAAEIEIVFNAFLKSHYGSLASQMTNWFSTSAAEEVSNEEPNWEVFQRNLLGIGNSINSSHGVQGISVFDLDGKRIFDYQLESSFQDFNTNPDQIKGLVDEAVKTESKVTGEIISRDGSPLLVLVIPSEDEDEEINYLHFYFMNISRLVERFSNDISLPTTFYLGDKYIDSENFAPFREVFTKQGKVSDLDLKGEFYKVRTSVIRPSMWNGRARLDVIVNMTSVQKAIITIELIGMGVIGLAILILSGLIYLQLNKLVRSIVERVNFLQNIAGETMKVSHQLKDSSERGYLIAAEEENEVQSTSAAAEEISHTLRSSQEHAQSCVKVSSGSKETAYHGSQVIDKMIEEIEEVGKVSTLFMEQVKAGNEKIVEIANTLDRISEKSKNINDIVFQTKLLSFNASVEAARAGENGKGFSVVAEEIGNLAQNSGTISNEINSIVESSVVEVKAVIEEILKTTETLSKDSLQKINNAAAVGGECKNSLEQILESSVKVDNSIGQISVATGEQTVAVGEIANSVRKIEGLSNQNRQAANQNKDFSVKMKDQVDKVFESTKQMKDLLLGQQLNSENKNIAIKNESGKVPHSIRPKKDVA
jgi:methyl-accepting chemotaxis protein